jgi:hypothetical protein
MKALCLLLSSLLLVACAPVTSGPLPTPNPAFPNTLVGLPLGTAQAMAEGANLPHRVIERDGQLLPRTMDYRPERLNFAVAGGRVINVTRG